MNRKSALQRRTALERKSRLRTKRPEPVSRDEKELRSEFWRVVTSNGKAADAVDGQPGSRDDPIEAHHVIQKQRLKRYAKTHGLPVASLVWDPRNGMPVRRSRHVNHTSAYERIPFSTVPSTAVDFAEELGLGWVLEAEYAS